MGASGQMRVYLHPTYGEMCLRVQIELQMPRPPNERLALKAGFIHPPRRQDAASRSALAGSCTRRYDHC